jgi:hypothetical protein
MNFDHSKLKLIVHTILNEGCVIVCRFKTGFDKLSPNGVK